MKKILIVVGTRPNFIKVTQFKKVAARDFPGTFDIKIVHTGQHYDNKMADVFFTQFDLVPDYFLEIPPSSPNSQMAEVMLRLEGVINAYGADLLLVTGDVNSTFAASLTANKMNIPLAHVESGLRSFDRSMPEEINRILTDEISNYLFVTEQSGIDNLKREGKKEDQLFFVGNTMIDTMVAFEDKINASTVLDKLELEEDTFALMTMHRPATVDNKKGLVKLIQVIDQISSKRNLVFPIHPRTSDRFKKFGLYQHLEGNKHLKLVEPMDYFSFQKLIKTCEFVITDSGGIQEETTFQQIPCLTLRPNTERPSTIDLGTNTLIPFDVDVIKKKVLQIENGNYKKGVIPPLWDGESTRRILDVVYNIFVQEEPLNGQEKKRESEVTS